MTVFTKARRTFYASAAILAATLGLAMIPGTANAQGFSFGFGTGGYGGDYAYFGFDVPYGYFGPGYGYYVPRYNYYVPRYKYYGPGYGYYYPRRRHRNYYYDQRAWPYPRHRHRYGRRW